MNASPPADEGNGGSNTVTTPEVQTNEPEVPEALVSHSPGTEPTQEAEAPAAAPPPPPVDPPAAEPRPPRTRRERDAAVIENPPAPVQAEAAQLIGGAAPTTDIVTALAYLFIALTDDNISFIEIPDNLLSFLGLSPMADGTTVSMNAGGIGGSLLAGGLYSAVRTQLASSRALQGGLPEMLLALGGSSSSSAPGVVHPTPGGVGASGMAEQHSVGLKATLAGGLVPDEVRSVIQHTVDAFLAPLSLVILAATGISRRRRTPASQCRGDVRRVPPSQGRLDAARGGNRALREVGPVGCRAVRQPRRRASAHVERGQKNSRAARNGISSPSPEQSDRFKPNICPAGID